MPRMERSLRHPVAVSTLVHLALAGSIGCGGLPRAERATPRPATAAPVGAAGPARPACANDQITAYDSLLVLAPHPDDEVLAFGGLIDAYLRQGKPVRVVVVTDGDAYCEACRFWISGSVTGPLCNAADLSNFATDEVDSFAEVRRAESRAALAVLGAPAPEFLGYPDTGLAASWANAEAGELPKALRRSDFSFGETCAEGYGAGPETDLSAGSLIDTLTDLVAAASPNGLVATTHWLDGHGDHAALGGFVRRLASELESPPAVAYGVIHAHTPKDTPHSDCWFPEPRAPACACFDEEQAANDPEWLATMRAHRYRPDWPARLPDDADYGAERQLCLPRAMYEGEDAIKRRAVTAYGSQLGLVARAGDVPPALAGLMDCNGYLISFVRSTEAFVLQEPRSPPASGWLDAGWQGHAISYSGYREGQSPEDRIYPSQAEILEDLEILDRHWDLIRTYAADQHSRDTLEVIRREGLGLKVMLGAYFAEEPGGEAENEQQIRDVIELANAYPDVVVAVNVGNEALIDWSLLPVPEERVMGYVRQVRDGVTVPVTVADNYAYWRDHGADLAELLDFVTVHTYPIWEKKDIDEGLSYTIENIDEVRRALPGKRLVIGEAGWATYAVGNQHVPRAGDEEKQRRYFRELTAWSREEGIPVFWFEAFDEPWKGTGTEGYWGLFDVHRRPKLAMHEWYPELVVDAPTSPEYTLEDLRTGPPMAIVFDEALAERIGGGGVNVAAGVEGGVVVSESDDAVSGETSLEMSHSGADWGGVFLYLDTPFDATSFSRLAVSLKRPAHVADLEIKLESAGGRGEGLSLDRFDSRDLGDGWREHSIALSEYPTPDLERLVILGFWHPRDARGEFAAGDILIDGIRFEQ